MPRYSSYPFRGFGKGLNLAAKPDSVDLAECIDALNVVFSDLGAIQQRAGYAAGNEVALTNRVESLSPYYTTGGLTQLLAGCGSRLEALNASFEVVKSATGLTNALWDFARFGQPNSELAYAGNGTDTLRKWNGIEWSTPTCSLDGEAGKAMPKGGSVCGCPALDNRLLVTRFSTGTGGPSGLTTSPSHAFLSEPGNPEAYETTSFIQFTPGDGEEIMRAITWRELTFVFKESKFFVLEGEGSDAEGKPEYIFRPVQAGVGLAAPQAVVSHPTGVYFMSRNGVYRTTGQEPELISSLVEPIWTGDTSVFYTGGSLAHSSIENCAMGTWQDRIYLAFPTEEANNRVLLYDPQYEWWSLLDIPASCFATFRPSGTDELVFGIASGEKKIGRHSSNYTNDNGAAIVSRFRSGWPDLENPDEKKIRAQKAWGTGKVSMALAEDFKQGVGTSVPLDFSDPAADDWGGTEWGTGEWAQPRGLVGKQRRIASRGTVFSVYFENTILDQDWSIHRLEYLVPAERDPAKGASA